MELFDKIVERDLSIRRLNLVVNHVVEESRASKAPIFEHLNLFTDYETLEARREQEEEAAELERERRRQQAVLAVKKKFGKNAILKAASYKEGATARGAMGKSAVIKRKGRCKMEQISDKYKEIIDLPHPTSKKHPRMAMTDRAAQFSPFSPLAGHGDALRETARLTDRRMELAESEQDALNRKLQMLAVCADKRPVVIVTYFQPDRKKAGAFIWRRQDRSNELTNMPRRLFLQMEIPF